MYTILVISFSAFALVILILAGGQYARSRRESQINQQHKQG